MIDQINITWEKILYWPKREYPNLLWITKTSNLLVKIINNEVKDNGINFLITLFNNFVSTLSKNIFLNFNPEYL